MKKILIMAAVLLCAGTAFAVEPMANDGSVLLAQYNSNEQVVRAYYPYNGQLASIKIKIRGSHVVAYSTGKDYIGNEEWRMVQTPAGITHTDSTFDGQLAREFNNKATLNISDGYHQSRITVYF
ncbi:MAG: hypothetical protein K2L45_09420 [Muribaculaceae bacterium]|nr:hypothetical protein [Muribaculaceae bacterium]